MFQIGGMNLDKPCSFRPVEVSLERSMSAPLTNESEKRRDSPTKSSHVEFFRSSSRCSRDTSSTLPLSPEPFYKKELLLSQPRSDSVLTVMDEDLPSPTKMFSPITLPSAQFSISKPALFDFNRNDGGKDHRQTITLKKDLTLECPKPFVCNKQSAPSTFFTKKLPAAAKLVTPRPVRATKVRAVSKLGQVSKPDSAASNIAKPSKTLGGKPKARRTDQKTKSIKGLKYLSSKICQTLARIRCATQDNMISMLYQTFICESDGNQEQSEKSIRRRIYDTINVLMALGLVKKTKQQIEWTGKSLPNLEEVETKRIDTLQRNIRASRERIKKKRKMLQDEELQLKRTQTLLERNHRGKKYSKRQRLADDALAPIYLPFLIVKAPSSSAIQCQASYDQTKCQLSFDKEVQIYNDYDILCLMAKSSLISI